MAGYLWQLRQALLFLLRADFGKAVEIESHEDIVIRGQDGQILSTIQAKHSFAEGELTLKSVELWKTIRVWVDLHTKKRITEDTPLLLCTTQAVEQALNPLTRGKRTKSELANLKKALDAIAQSASNQELAPAYTAWRTIDQSRQISLLTQARILAIQHRLSELDTDIGNAMRRLAFSPQSLNFFKEKLLGWFDRLVDSRLKPGGCAITFEELNDQLTELHYMQVPPQLVATRSNEAHPTLLEERKSDPIYLRQLNLIELNENELAHAVAMFHRGRAELNDWLNAHPNGLTTRRNYEKDLETKWIGFRNKLLRDKPSDPVAMVKCGRELHDKCMDYHGNYGGYTPPTHVGNGAYHSLANSPADKPTVGWHPEYTDRLKPPGEQE